MFDDYKDNDAENYKLNFRELEKKFFKDNNISVGKDLTDKWSLIIKSDCSFSIPYYYLDEIVEVISFNTYLDECRKKLNSKVSTNFNNNVKNEIAKLLVYIYEYNNVYIKKDLSIINNLIINVLKLLHRL